MTRTILITAGTSILDNLRQLGDRDLYNIVDRLQLPTGDRMAELLAKPAAPWAGAAATPRTAGSPGAWWFIDHYGRRSPRDDANIHAAELASLRLLQPTPDDEIIFLCSDTPNGLFCGLVVAHLIKQRDDPILVRSQPTAASPVQTTEVDWGWNITDSHVPHTDMPRAGAGKVSLWQIPGLNPHNRRGFERQGAGNLVRTFIRLAREAGAKGHPFIVNFTGGYKATIPLLTLVASWLGSPAVTMVALYQDTTELLSIPTTDSRPSESLWQELCRLKGDTNARPHEVDAGRRRYFKEEARPGGGLEWSLLGEALAIYFESPEGGSQS